MKIVQTEDVDLIRTIMTHPQVWPHISDDASGAPEKFDPSGLVGKAHFLLAVDGDEVCGMYLVHRHNAVLYEVHTCILPHAYGERADAAAQALLDWVFAHTECRHLMTFVPKPNRTALAYAQRAGLQIEGNVPASFLKDGVAHDQTLLGIGKEQRCQQQQRLPAAQLSAA